MKITDLRPQAYRLGYNIGRERKHVLATRQDSAAYIRKWHPGCRYFTAPLSGSGPWTYFPSLEDVQRYLTEVEQIRQGPEES